MPRERIQDTQREEARPLEGGEEGSGDPQRLLGIHNPKHHLYRDGYRHITGAPWDQSLIGIVPSGVWIAWGVYAVLGMKKNEISIEDFVKEGRGGEEVADKNLGGIGRGDDVALEMGLMGVLF